MIHHTTSWIPESYGRYFHAVSHSQQKFADNKKTIFFSHGSGDMLSTVTEIASDYYFCWTKEETEHVRSLGGKAFYVGSSYIDDTFPEKRNPNLLVYCPQHVPFRDVDIKKQDIKPLSCSEIQALMDEHECDDYIVSITDDTDQYRLRHLRKYFFYSNRYKGNGHVRKCKHLYENAKVIYTDIPSTFTQTARSFGIKCIGDTGMILTTPSKPNCKRNMLDIMNHIIKTKLTN